MSNYYGRSLPSSSATYPACYGGNAKPAKVYRSREGWTDERIDLLKKQWAEGLSASMIAGNLGDVSRNAVIGKLHRLGLTSRPTSQRVKSRSGLSKAQHRAARKSASMIQKRSNAFGPVDPLPTPSVADVGRVALADTTDAMCLWIVGDTRPVALCCGADRVPGVSYCLDHARRAYSSPQERRAAPSYTIYDVKAKKVTVDA